jgi:hypothetical protein
MTRTKYVGRGTENAEIILYPETSAEENMINDILSNLDDLYNETYSSCWDWDGNTACWSGYALHWDDTFVSWDTNWDDGGDYHSDLDTAGFDDPTVIHMGLINDASNSGNCGGSWGRSPYCDTEKPIPFVDMDCQSDAADAAQTAGMEGNHCLINSDNSDVQDLTNSDGNQHSLGKFIAGGWFSNPKCTPMICGYDGLSGEGNCSGDGSGNRNPKLSFTNCTHYSVAVSEGDC